MVSWLCFGVFSTLLLMRISSVFTFTQNLTCVNISVPIVNSCNGLSALFRKNWHYRHTFDVIIRNGTGVKFELLNPESIGGGQFFVTCQNAESYNDLVIPFSKTEISRDITIDHTCVPTVGVLKLCNENPIHLVVKLSIAEQSSVQYFQHLPTIEVKSFETYNGVDRGLEKFFNEIENETDNVIVDYGFVKTPRALVLIQRSDVKDLKLGNRFYHGLKIINDAMEKYIEYSGRSSIPITNGPHINMDLEKQVIFLKSEQCTGGPQECTQKSKVCSSFSKSKGCTNTFLEDDKENYTALFQYPPKYGKNNVDLFGERIACNTCANGYYNPDKSVAIGNSILPFFPQNLTSYGGLVPVHEIAHHFDLETTDVYINLHEAWVNVYAFLYLSRFKYENISYYYSISNDEEAKGFGCKTQNKYHQKTPLQDFCIGELAHFLTALFTLDNHDASAFRSYNIRTMNDSDITNNILRSIAVFIKDQYDVNVVPFIERVIYKGIAWLNITNIYDLAESRNFRMPCFYFPDASDYPQYRYTEHNLKVASNLRLCPTVTKGSKKIKITINNTDLINKKIMINSMVETVLPTPITIESNEEVFVFWGAINESAIVLPTYEFCGSNTKYQCTVTPKLLTYGDEDLSILLPPFIFHIFDIADRLAAVLQVDVNEKTLLIHSVESTWTSSRFKYMIINLYNDTNHLVENFRINTPIKCMGKKIMKFDYNYRLEFNFEDENCTTANRVKILDYTLNDLQTTNFIIDESGIWEHPTREGRIQKRLAEILTNDLEYKPYLKNHQHLIHLLWFLRNISGK